MFFFFFQAEDGIRDYKVTGVQTCALPISSAEATEAAGERLATALAPGAVVALVGELGAGKTCFIQGLVRGLGATTRATSPTFVLINEYRGRVDRKSTRLNSSHLVISYAVFCLKKKKKNKKKD